MGPSGIRLLDLEQTPLTAFANISATFIRILLWPLAVREMLVPSDVILEPAARSWKRGRLVASSRSPSFAFRSCSKRVMIRAYRVTRERFLAVAVDPLTHIRR